VNCPYLVAPKTCTLGSLTVSALANTRIKVPISAARILQQQGIGTVCLPAFLDLQNGFLQQFKGATPNSETCCVLPLNQYTPFFFEVALKCISLCRDSSSVDAKALELDNLEQLIHTILNERTKRICALALMECPSESYLDAQALRSWAELQGSQRGMSSGAKEVTPMNDTDIAFLSTLTVPEKELLHKRTMVIRGLQ